MTIHASNYCYWAYIPIAVTYSLFLFVFVFAIFFFSRFQFNNEKLEGKKIFHTS